LTTPSQLTLDILHFVFVQSKCGFLLDFQSTQETECGLRGAECGFQGTKTPGRVEEIRFNGGQRLALGGRVQVGDGRSREVLGAEAGGAKGSWKKGRNDIEMQRIRQRVEKYLFIF
jgi:hypothetical protein